MSCDLLLVNGDSYSASEIDKTYADYLGISLNLPVHNLAVVGANNDRIRRTTVEKIMELKDQGQTPLVIVAWSFLTRSEIWYDGNDQHIIDQIPDQQYTDSQRKGRLMTLDFAIGKDTTDAEYKHAILNTPRIQKLLTDFYLDIYLFSRFLYQHAVPYRFFFAADHRNFPVSDFPYIVDRKFVKQCQADPNIYDLGGFSISSWAFANDAECNQTTGHLSASGHNKFSQWMIKNLDLSIYQRTG